MSDITKVNSICEVLYGFEYLFTSVLTGESFKVKRDGSWLIGEQGQDISLENGLLNYSYRLNFLNEADADEAARTMVLWWADDMDDAEGDNY